MPPSQSVHTADATEPLSTNAFLLLLAKLPSLRAFDWQAPRVPPPQLCPALGTACKSLTSFSFALDSASTVDPADPGLSSPTPAALTTARWDAPDLSALPVTLQGLALSNLSHDGARSLGAALSSFPVLEQLELARFPFVDDELLTELGQAGLRRLKLLRIREMTGTRLTEKGLGEVLAECDGLEEVVLDNVQGESGD